MGAVSQRSAWVRWKHIPSRYEESEELVGCDNGYYSFVLMHRTHSYCSNVFTHELYSLLSMHISYSLPQSLRIRLYIPRLGLLGSSRTSLPQPHPPLRRVHRSRSRVQARPNVGKEIVNMAHNHAQYLVFRYTPMHEQTESHQHPRQIWCIEYQ